MRRRAILIGNGSFPPESELASLAGPAADVHRLAEVLSDPAVGGFETDELIDQASYELLPRIEQRFHEAEPDDLLLVHYSGHGKLNRLGQLFLACRNTVAATLQTTSVPVELLRELVRGCDARSVVLVLDCCFSGAAARAFLRSNVEDRLQALNGEGIYLLTSVDAIHSAEEGDESDGETMGLFTRHVVTGLESGEADVDRDGKITINDLQLYLSRSIRRQSPRFWTFDAGQDVVLCHRGKPKVAELHPGLRTALANPFASVRFAALEDLERLLSTGDTAMRPAVIAALERASDDDSRKVSRKARSVLAGWESQEPETEAPQPDQGPSPPSTGDDASYLGESARLTAPPDPAFWPPSDPMSAVPVPAPDSASAVANEPSRDTVASSRLGSSVPFAHSLLPPDEAAKPRAVITPVSVSVQKPGKSNKPLKLTTLLGCVGFLLGALLFMSIILATGQPQSSGSNSREGASAPPSQEPALAAPIVVTVDVTEECWIEVRTDGGTPKVARLFVPGESIEILAQNDVSLTLGNGGGVDISVNHMPLAVDGRPGEALDVTIDWGTVFRLRGQSP